MTENQAIKKAKEFTDHTCELCGEPIAPADLAVFPMQDGPDDYLNVPCHSWCLSKQEELMYRSACVEPDEVYL